MSQANLDRRGSTAVAVELYQWRPEWGLGSMDPNCLAANIYLTMCGVRYRKNDCNNPAMSPRGYLPFLKVEETGLWELDEIFQYADNQLYSLWCDSANYQAVTQPIYGSMYTWPVSWILPSRMRSQAAQAVGDVTGGRPWKEIQADAATAFVALSNRLADQQYFFGDRPSRLDALVFGHLAVILKCPTPTEDLQRLLLSHAPLVKFCKQIERIYSR